MGFPERRRAFWNNWTRHLEGENLISENSEMGMLGATLNPMSNFYLLENSGKAGCDSYSPVHVAVG